MKPLTVSDLVARKGKVLQLEILTDDVGLDRPIRVPQVSSPGLVLAGYVKRFPAKRVHVLGETEVEYLRSLSVEDRRKAWEGLINFDLPCVFVTKGQRFPKEPNFRLQSSTSGSHRTSPRFLRHVRSSTVP